MEWPSEVHLNEIQSRLINDGVPVERAMYAVSQLGLMKYGERYPVRRGDDTLIFYATMHQGYFHVVTE